jgi:hypothetical protein
MTTETVPRLWAASARPAKADILGALRRAEIAPAALYAALGVTRQRCHQLLDKRSERVRVAALALVAAKRTEIGAHADALDAAARVLRGELRGSMER